MIENGEPAEKSRVPQVRVVAASSCAAAVPSRYAGDRDAAGATAAAAPGSRRGWASVGAVALGAFVIVMTETLPVGLLPQVAGGLHVSLGLAGLMVLVPGFSAAVSAPLFFLGSGRFDRRSVILVLGLTVLVANAVVAVAPNFVLVLIARMLFGATLGAFWTVVSPVGPKLVGPAGGTRAITVIAAGISGGTVVGLPAGQFLGDVVGWRAAFAIAAAATLLVVVAQTVLLPGIPPDGRTHLRDLVAVVKRRAARFGMAAGAVVFIGQFAAWTYITPFLTDHTHLSSSVISLLYVLYGCAGIAGSLVAGSLFRRGVIGSFAGTATAVAALLVGLASAGTMPWTAGLLFVLWGLFWGVVNPGTLVWILDAAHETPEAASAVNVTNLQIALAVGSGLGAVLVSSTTLPALFLTAGFIVLAAAVLAGLAARFVTLAVRQ
ncbi:Predicted arabinose efflux permease, MFS family [Nonomuraea maritima]|uniref:Predicted arabinose efflux permease, MFS family n=1 Tax=Nonomuraea maritima TaxID=683260 RepID=A0A1G8S3R4_9ACTN|nr:MFS transporter [Nonomuraea maritima]SDJ23904.1 Predicted arabinose efflux permease, MFS family [Nonomuraea maritima]